MKLWNLETFKCVASTDPGTAPVQQINFFDDNSIICATNDHVKRYGDLNNLGSGQTDYFEAEWGNGLKDMQVSAQNKVLLCVFIRQGLVCQFRSRYY